MFAFTLRRAVGLATTGLILGLIAIALAACSSSGSSQAGAAASSGKAAVSSALANPTTSADIAQLESELLTAYQKNFSPLHPFKSMQVAIHVVFPQGDAAKIATYAVQQLTPDMAGTSAKAHAARQAWAAKVIKFGLGPNGSTAPPSGSANIPGVTNPATPSASAKSS